MYVTFITTIKVLNRIPNTSPERTVQMAAKALILSAYISLFKQSNSNSIHIIRNPIASRVIYMNSENKASQRTPENFLYIIYINRHVR